VCVWRISSDGPHGVAFEPGPGSRIVTVWTFLFRDSKKAGTLLSLG
jgi:hypothetical protein